MAQTVRLQLQRQQRPCAANQQHLCDLLLQLLG
jgi:hypothetical protein